MPTPEDIRKSHEDKFSKMQSENYGDSPILEISQPKAVNDPLLSAVSNIAVMSSGNVELPLAPMAEQQPAPSVPEEQDFAQEEWNYTHETAAPVDGIHQPQRVEAVAPQAPLGLVNQANAIASEPPDVASNPTQVVTPQTNSAPQPPFSSREYLTSHYAIAPANEYLARQYGVTARSQGFSFSGSETSKDVKQTAGRPQPSQASGTPSHPSPIFTSAPQASLPEPEDIDSPAGETLGQNPQEGKRRQNTAQAANLAESLDMALEQTLVILDQMASKLQSFSQRLVVIESIIDRTY